MQPADKGTTKMASDERQQKLNDEFANWWRCDYCRAEFPSEQLTTAHVHDTHTCACELCVWAESQERARLVSDIAVLDDIDTVATHLHRRKFLVAEIDRLQNELNELDKWIDAEELSS